MDPNKNLITDINALFLGPKSENGDFFKDVLINCVNDHLYWRKDFHPEDDPIISYMEKEQPSDKEIQDKTYRKKDL